jgi:hypothetical protein
MIQYFLQILPYHHLRRLASPNPHHLTCSVNRDLHPNLIQISWTVLILTYSVFNIKKFPFIQAYLWINSLPLFALHSIYNSFLRPTLFKRCLFVWVSLFLPRNRLLRTLRNNYQEFFDFLPLIFYYLPNPSFLNASQHNSRLAQSPGIP